MGIEPTYSSSAGCPANQQAYKQCSNGTFSSYRSPSQNNSQSLRFADSKAGFKEYVRYKKYQVRVAKSMVNYLNRYVGTVRDARDIMAIFSPLTDGQAHNLNRAMRAWFNYLQIIGAASKAHLDNLRAAIPRDATFIDLHVPDESQIAADLKRLSKAPLNFRAVWNLCLDSELRLVEAMALINNFAEPERRKGFCRTELGMFRGGKNAYYGYYSEHTYALIQKVREQFSQISVEKYAQNHDFTRFKYLRKFSFDKMLELQVPESCADFIAGRVAKKVGARHYADLRRQADIHYPRYVKYLTKLRAKAAAEGD
jgi:intergrase/recombinase